MLVGLVAKNAILIVEFAKEETDKGIDAVQAALTAARLRFRPLVMTSLAFMLGLLPLVFATGPGSAARRDIGTGVFFGMLVAITVGIVFVPFFFVLIDKAKKNYRKNESKTIDISLCGNNAWLLFRVKNCRKPQLDLPMSLAGNATDSITLADMEWWSFYSDSTLVGLIREALEHNRDFLAAAAKVEQMRQLYGVQKLNYAPTVSGLALADHETNDYHGKPHSDQPEYSPKASLSWEVDLWGGLKWSQRKGAAEFRASVENQRAMQMTLVSEIASAYVNLLALDNELSIVRRTLFTREENLKKAKLRFEGGLTPETVYQQAQVEYASAAALIPGLERQIEIQKNAISLLLGRYPGRGNQPRQTIV